MISKKLKAWRVKHNLSQSQAAMRLNVPIRTLQEWEQARRRPRGMAVAALEYALK